MANSLKVDFPFVVRLLLAIVLFSIFFFLVFQRGEKHSVLPTDAHMLDTNLVVFKANELMRENKYKEAQAELMMALQFEPRNIYANDALSRVLARSDQTQREILKTAAVTLKRPDYKAAWEKLANLYEITGDLDNARKARETANTLKVI